MSVLSMTTEQLRVGQKIKTKNGWFNITRIWVSCGKTVKVDLSVNGKEKNGIDAEELCKHILEWTVL